MIYTLNRGVDRQVKTRIFRGASLSLPLLALIFLAIAIFSASTQHGAGQNPYIKNNPKSLSSTFNGQHNSNSASSNSSKSVSGSSSNQPTSLGSTPTTPAMSMNTLGGSGSTPPVSSAPAVASTPSSTPVTGGLGGGDTSGGTTGSGGGTGGSSSPAGSTNGGVSAGSGSTTTTVACTNLLTLAQVCTACTPTITLQPGQKALLAADGTCVAVN